MLGIALDERASIARRVTSGQPTIARFSGRGTFDAHSGGTLIEARKMAAVGRTLTGLTRAACATG